MLFRASDSPSAREIRQKQKDPCRQNPRPEDARLHLKAVRTASNCDSQRRNGRSAGFSALLTAIEAC